ncbi:carcinoembryonic antigen-related cell adhesion molecule 1-like [Pelobates fuscus]|uniref:carcinoembryonic antigen-related cell adhesion molecule 1-like n=1 Tax=Pelobates fuscus TaxID=191477 RepID=UPI002FE4496F
MVLLATWMDLASTIDIYLIPSYPIIDQSVTLQVADINGTVRSFAWFNGTVVHTQNQILSYSSRNNPPQVAGTQYFSRATGFPNGSLHITNLVTTDQGIYTVEVQTSKRVQRASVYLTVYDYVTKPVVRASNCHPLQNEAVNLTCVTIHAQTILWGRGNAELPLSATLSPDNQTVTFSSIKPSDGGEYWCEAVNPVSNSTSDTYLLTVTCACKSQTASCAAVTSGIICGTILGTILTIAATFLLYNYYIIPKTKEKTKRREFVAESRSENQAPSTIYYNMHAVPGVKNQSPREESSYMDLEYKSQDTYTELQK